jgi:hypothetical protein
VPLARCQGGTETRDRWLAVLGIDLRGLSILFPLFGVVNGGIWV